MDYLSEKTIKDIKDRTRLITHPSGRKERVFLKNYPDLMDEHNHFRYRMDRDFTQNLRVCQIETWDKLANPSLKTRILTSLKRIYYKYLR